MERRTSPHAIQRAKTQDAGRPIGIVDRLAVSTIVYVSPEEVYDFLREFPRYARYSKYLRRVDQHGDGGPGTEYDLEFTWWKLSYTVRSRVTDVEPPRTIDWTIVGKLDASGRWRIEERKAEESRETSACRVYFEVGFDPDSASRDLLDLPRLIPFERVRSEAIGLIQEEAERVVERVVADLEGQRREVELTVHETPGSNTDRTSE